MTHPRHRESRITVYSLKRELGQLITLCRTTNDVVNKITGLQTSDVHKLYIRRAVFVTAKMLRGFTYDLSFIAANKNFTYGGFFDRKHRLVLVDRRDIARADSDWPVDLNMYVLHKDKRWEVKEIFDYDDEEAVLLLLEGLENALKLENHEVEVEQDLDVDDEASGEIQ